jgi:hypothetical protein
MKSAIIAACLCSESGNAFPGDDWNHDQCGNGIHPPPTEECIQQQATQENPAKVRTEIRLFRIRVHSSAADLSSNSPFCSRQKRHDNHRSARDHDAGDASLRWNVPYQRQTRFVHDVQRERNEARSDRSQRCAFGLLTP